jgi:hypothetical protein
VGGEWEWVVHCSSNSTVVGQFAQTRRLDDQAPPQCRVDFTNSPPSLAGVVMMQNIKILDWKDEV